MQPPAAEALQKKVNPLKTRSKINKVLFFKFEDIPPNTLYSYTTRAQGTNTDIARTHILVSVFYPMFKYGTLQEEFGCTKHAPKSRAGDNCHMVTFSTVLPRESVYLDAPCRHTANSYGVPGAKRRVQSALHHYSNLKRVLEESNKQIRYPAGVLRTQIGAVNIPVH